MYHEALAPTTAPRDYECCRLVLANATKGWKFYTVKTRSGLFISNGQMKVGNKTHIAATVWLENRRPAILLILCEASAYQTPSRFAPFSIVTRANQFVPECPFLTRF